MAATVPHSHSHWSSSSSSPTLRASSMEISLSISPVRSLSLLYNHHPLRFPSLITTTKNDPNRRTTLLYRCSDSDNYTTAAAMAMSNSPPPPPVMRKRRRYRKQYPGEKEGITEEMRFVAMRLRNVRGKKIERDSSDEDEDNGGGGGGEIGSDSESNSSETWQPSIEGFVKFIVDSKLVFDTVERIVDESEDVSYAYFRRTGLERSKGLSKDLEWFSEQDLVIPPPSNPGITYAKYLEELAEKSAPLFLSHVYNIYFSHIAGGQVIAKKVSEKLLAGRELEFYKWDGDTGELLKGVQDKLNMLGEHWSRDEKNKCLREATKSFRFLGQIVRLIIL